MIPNIPSDNIANYIGSLWRGWSDERNVWLNRTTEVRQYLTAPDTTYTEVGSLPWKNKTCVPKLTQIYDNLLAQYVSALFPTDWFAFQGNTAKDQEKKSYTEAYLDAKLYQSGFKSLAREQLIPDWITYGVVCGGVHHVHEKTTSVVDGEEVTKYYGAKGFRVSPYDYVIDPRASSFEESPFIHRRVITIPELKKEMETITNIKYEEDVINNLVGTRGYIRDNEDSLKESNLTVDGFSSLREYFDSGYVEVLTYWGDFYDSSTDTMYYNQSIAVVDKMFILYNIANPMPNGKKPFSFSSWRPRPDNLYGQGALEQLVGMQYRIDHLENLKADVFDLIAHPPVVVTGDPTEDFEWEPGSVYYAGTEGGVSVLAPNAAALQSDMYIDKYMLWMEENAGAPKQSAGHRTPGEKTAFEVGVLDSGGKKMFVEKVGHFEDTFLRSFLENFYVLTATNFNMNDIIRVFNDDVGAYQIVEVTKEQVLADGTFMPQGSKHYERKGRVLQEAQQVLGVVASNPALAQHLSGMDVLATIEREMGLERQDWFQEFKAIVDQLDGQAVAQMHQKELQQMTGEGNANMQPTAEGATGTQ